MENEFSWIKEDELLNRNRIDIQWNRIINPDFKVRECVLSFIFIFMFSFGFLVVN